MTRDNMASRRRRSQIKRWALSVLVASVILVPVIVSTSAMAGGLSKAPARNDEAIARVAAGETDVANAAWWGFDSNDATEALQSAIDSKAQTTIVPFTGCDWNVRPIKLRSDLTLVLQPGVVLTAKAGASHGKRDALLSARAVRHLTISGYGAEVRMHKQDYLGPDYAKSEWRHALALFGVEQVHIEGLTFSQSGGDGIYIGSNASHGRRAPSRVVTIKDCTCDQNFRQGITVVSADDLAIANCVLSGTSGTPPQAGLDIEPANDGDAISNVRITNCVSRGNGGDGFIVSLGRLTDASKPVSVLMMDCLADDNRGSGIQTRVGEVAPRGLVAFRNVTVTRARQAGLFNLWKATSPAFEVRFINCKWDDVAYDYSKGPFYMELPPVPEVPAIGGLRFDGCRLYLDRSEPFLHLVDKQGRNGPFDVKGDISVIVKQGDIVEPPVVARTPKLRVSYVHP